MKNDLTGLLNLAYEIEGLILLQINRGDEAAPEMKDLLVRKARTLLEGLDGPAEAEVMAPAATVAAPAPEVAAEPEPEVTSAEPEVEDEEIAASVEFEENADADTSAKPSVEENASKQTVEEKLARERAADITKAFTLNDRFRFRRELFRNSDDEFRETIDVIGTMADMDEAEEYFYNDLCWDPEREEVKEFMAIVAKHF